MKTINIILLTFTCLISSHLMGQSYTLNQLIGTWDFVSMGGQPASAGAQLVLDANNTGTISLGGGTEAITYRLDNDVFYLNTTSIGDAEMEILSCRNNILKMKDKSSGDLVELKKQVPTFTDPRDGEVYEIVVIGNQTWMAENLRFNAPGSKVYPNSPSPKYGRLYDWATVMNIDAKYNREKWGGSDKNHQGICPKGWHLPSDAEWTAMEQHLGMSASDNLKLSRGSHGKGLKSTTGWNGSGNGDNSSGFNAYPAGQWTTQEYMDLSMAGHFWSATELTADELKSHGGQFYYAWKRIAVDYSSEVLRGAFTLSKGFGLSCRCIKD